jgi:hypothetical protein
MQTAEMMATHPDVKGQVSSKLIEVIDAAYACADTCTACVDACLAEQMVADLRQCIRLNLDCADVCLTCARLATRRTGTNEQLMRQMLDACVIACGLCRDECARHASAHEHCRLCADACLRCVGACKLARDTM